MLRKQLAAAIGKEVSPADFAAYMRPDARFIDALKLRTMDFPMNKIPKPRPLVPCRPSQLLIKP